jgi:CHASE1-domain containing sensor protein
VCSSDLACVVSATVGAGSLVWVGAVTPAAAVHVALAWWLGDSLGVLAAVLPALTLIGRPRPLWESRRLTVGLPMLMLTGLLALATMLLTRSDERRTQATFEREALRADHAVKSGLLMPLHALEALRGLYRGSDQVTARDFERASEPWLAESPSLAAMGYSARVAREQVDSFVQRLRETEPRPYRIFNRADAAPGLTDADTDVVAVLRIEPTSRNASALGVNALSVAAARAAIERAAATDQVAVTEGFRLTQAVGDETGLVYYRALYNGEIGRAHV